MDSAKNQLVEKLNSATNILVTVSRNPSVDQLSACVALTLLLNKLGKHATAVFSGATPSTIEFLEPEHTIEKNTDSLRDFIIALDKAKADKLRYKVEDDMVRIFITPYRTSITDKDLEFSQGDFNVDLVVALGVTRQEDFDDAITSHGRILHDATVSSITTGNGVELGSINWAEPQASSLSELVVDLSHLVGENLMDAQIATALLTGIVSETGRFSNEKTTPRTMSASAELMAAGANQQLVATKLEEPAPKPANEPAPEKSADKTEEEAQKEPESSHDGALEIDHPKADTSTTDAPTDSENNNESPDSTNDSKEPESQDADQELDTSREAVPKTSKRIVEPPALTGTLTANSAPEQLDPALDTLGVNKDNPGLLLNHDTLPAPEEPAAPPEATPPTEAPAPTPKRADPILTGFTPPPPAWVPPSESTSGFGPQEPGNPPTLTDIEASVHSPHVQTEDLEEARDEVLRALSSEPGVPGPVQALGAQPLGDPLRPAEPAPGFTDALQQAIPAMPPEPTLPGLNVPPPSVTSPSASPVTDPTAPPPVPPPIPFNFGPPPPPPAQ